MKIPASKDPNTQEYWDKRLESEGMPAELPMIPRVQTRADVERYEQTPGVRPDTTLAYLNDARARIQEIPNPRDRLVWEHHSDGKSVREVSSEISRSKSSVDRVIRRLRRLFSRSDAGGGS